MNNYFKAFCISLLLVIVFSFLLYNLFNPVNLIYRYIFSWSFHLILVLVLSKLLSNKTILFFISFGPTILIDLTVFIDGLTLIPLRFPFATIFSFSGALTGLIILKRKIFPIITSLGASFIFFFFSHFVFIPAIIWQMQIEDKLVLKSDFLNSSFRTITGKTIQLSDTLRSQQIQLLELYFVSCYPCILKYEELKKLRKAYHETDLAIVMICDGSISNYNEFKLDANNSKGKGIIYLFDETGNIKNKIGEISGYPTEILLTRNKIYQKLTGFAPEVKRLYFMSQKKLIDQILYTENAN